MLEDLINELGWRGGTKHQALAEVRRLILENQAQQNMLDRIEIWAHNNGEPSLQEMIDELEANHE